MRLINIEIICPSTSRSYDYRIPPPMNSEAVKKRIIADIRIYEGVEDLFSNEDDIRLYRENMSVIGTDVSMEAAGVRNGDKIMLI